MTLSGAVDRFTIELKSLYEAAGKPTLSQLVRLATKQAPPIKISDSTISAWLNSGHVPGPGPKEKYFVLLVNYLQKRAEKRDHPQRSEGAWLHLLHAAREERKAHRGGRPIKDAEHAQPSAPGEWHSAENLPPQPVGFVGRDDHLADLLDQLDPQQARQRPATVTAVSGMGGTGKTTLAIEAAYRARERGWFSGGMLFVDMRGYSSNDSDLKAENAAEQLLQHLGVPENDIQLTGSGVLDLWRTHTGLRSRQKRPLLIILDNVSTASQVAPLIPASSDHRILITTRHVLASLPGRQIQIDELPQANALAIIDQALRIANPGDSRVADNPEDAAQLASLCGRLPLALQIGAALLKIEPNRSLASLVDELRDARNRLDSLEYGEVDVLGNPLAVRAAFALSYRRLSPAEARAFRLLALAPGPDFSLETAGVLLEATGPGTRQFIRKLMSAHLIVSQSSERWLMHDLIRLYAEEKAEEEEHNSEASEALRRILLHLLAVAEEADQQIRWASDEAQGEQFPSRGDAWDWMVSEHRTLVSAVFYAYHAEWDVVAMAIAMRLDGYFKHNRHATDWEDVYDIALKACHRYGEPRLTIELLSTIGGLYDAARQSEIALSFHREAIDLLAKIDHHPSKASVFNHTATSLLDTLRFEEALPYFRKALTAYRKDGDIRGEGLVLHNLGSLLNKLGEPKQALEYLQRDLTICQELGDRKGAGETLNTLGCAYYDLRDYEKAATSFKQSLNIAREFQDRDQEGQVLKNLANAYVELGKLPEALSLYEQALQVQRVSGDRYREAETLMNLGATHEEIGQIGNAADCFKKAAAAFQEAGNTDGLLAAQRWMQNLRTRSPFHNR
ncbi:ATP-binding protein [Streptomyces erythrochromogenes]|uniref:ATP-binding protein n=1 Tax=Streptomyces erythrochromogenes TaxID=285574 RepID=UPI003690C54E